ncbi:hypothetical protein [Actinophytocola oryzae]|uniref:hypothetical protein n=1 Tax=Actinophytocola oryzae TaxID=502181 RepID=UPI001AAEB18A|nr:hypothetical protein [Actinophytocola oryzae]
MVVRSEGAQTLVEAIDPAATVTITDEQALEPVADEPARLPPSTRSSTRRRTGDTTSPLLGRPTVREWRG